MLKPVTSSLSDKLDEISESTWQSIEQRGIFFEADAGDTILEPGQSEENLLIVLSGIATLLYYRDGAFRPSAIYRPRGQVLLHPGMHLKLGNPFRIAAQVDATRFVMLGRETVYQLIARDVSFAEFLFRDLSERLLTALNYLREERDEPLLIRLAKRLLTMAYKDETVTLTQAEIAEILAVTRISVSKSLKTLEELGLVKRTQRSLIEIDRERLVRWLNEQT